MREGSEHASPPPERTFYRPTTSPPPHHYLTTTSPQAFFRLNTDLVGLIDSWGEGFVDELDYLKVRPNLPPI